MQQQQPDRAPDGGVGAVAGPERAVPTLKRTLATSPDTMTIGATGCVVAFTPRRLISGCASARIAVSTTGNAGGHPASTALTATTRRVTMPARRQHGEHLVGVAGGELEHGLDPVRCRRDEGQPVAPAVGLEEGVHRLRIGVCGELQQTVGVDGGHVRGQGTAVDAAADRVDA